MMIKDLEMSQDLTPEELSARRRAGVRSWAAGVAALSVVAGVLAGPVPARADSTIDSIICMNSASGTLSVSNPMPEWLDPPILTWSANLPTACATAGGGLVLLQNGSRVGGSGLGYVGPSGSISVPSKKSKDDWILRIETAQGSKDLASVTVTVTLPGKLTDGSTEVTITSNTVDQRKRFVQAVQTLGVTVHIAADVNLDLSGLEFVPVASGVQILGDRTAVDRAGPRLFTTTFPHVLFMIGDDNPNHPSTSDHVHISGIRLDGGESDDPFSAVGQPDADGIGVYSSQYVEIDHNEIYRWRGSAVNVHDGNDTNQPDYRGRINQDNADTVWVHDNYIHHNQHPSSNVCGSGPLDGGGHAAGYGVQASDGAYVLIERNVFDWNRHSIAGDGKTGTGYRAYSNLILTNGGVHFRCVNSTAEAVAFVLSPFVTTLYVVAEALDGDSIYHTHAIDMHAVNSCTNGLFVGDTSDPLGDHNCGPAGEYMDIQYNTILYTAGNGIHLRGTPMLAPTSPSNTTKVGMNVMHNVFAHENHDGGFLTPGAMLQNETGLHDSDNILGLNTFNDRKSCDFDGDGISDPFIATGVTWWYASSALGGRWVYLNQSPLRVADVTLSDFDGDGRCDVAAGGQVFLNPDPQPFARSPGNVSTLLGTPVTVNLAASGGALPYIWNVSGLPPGLSASAAGQISGTPVANGTPTYAVTATVTDANHQPSTVTFTWTLVARVPSLLGLDQGTAEDLITAAGLQVGKVSNSNNCVSPGDVLTQNPTAGNTSPVGSPVDITVSTCTTGGGGGGGGGHILPK